MLNQEIPCKPTRVVAGHEPENTNLLLQAIYECAVSGQDSSQLSKKICKKYMGEVNGGAAEEQKENKEDQKKQEQKKMEEQKKEEQKKIEQKQEQQRLEQQKLEQQKQE